MQDGVKTPVKHDKMERYVATIQNISILKQPFPVATATPEPQKKQQQAKEEADSWTRQGPQTAHSLLLTCPGHTACMTPLARCTEQ